MPGKITNQLKDENKVSDFFFLVPLLGLTPCVFTALHKAFAVLCFSKYDLPQGLLFADHNQRTAE
jgi:hypothetical protein